MGRRAFRSTDSWFSIRIFINGSPNPVKNVKRGDHPKHPHGKRDRPKVKNSRLTTGSPNWITRSIGVSIFLLQGKCPAQRTAIQHHYEGAGKKESL